MDLIGIEPMTSSMPWKRAPSCATGPLLGRTVSILRPAGRLVKLNVYRSAELEAKPSQAEVTNCVPRAANWLMRLHFQEHISWGRELIRRASVSKASRVSEHSAAGGAVLQLLSMWVLSFVTGSAKGFGRTRFATGSMKP